MSGSATSHIRAKITMTLHSTPANPGFRCSSPLRGRCRRMPTGGGTPVTLRVGAGRGPMAGRGESAALRVAPPDTKQNTALRLSPTGRGQSCAARQVRDCQKPVPAHGAPLHHHSRHACHQCGAGTYPHLQPAQPIEIPDSTKIFTQIYPPSRTVRHNLLACSFGKVMPVHPV